MAGIKIVDLPPLGRDLASTDLLELSLAGGTGSRKITGQEIMNTSKLNIGTTAITSGVVGRVLFEGAGNVVQESSSLFWDATNNRLGISTSSPTQTLDIVGSLNSTSSLNGDLDNLIIRNTLNGAASQTRLRFYNELTPSTTTGGAIFYTSNAYSGFPSNSFGFWNYNTNGVIAFATSVERMRIASTGNVLIGTTTDAGFRLDVNGTARVQGLTTLSDGLRINGGWTTFNASTIFGSSAQSGNTFNFATQYIGGATGTTNYFNFSGTLASGTGGSFNVFNVQQTFSNTNSAQTFRGFYYNPNITGLQAGTAHRAIETTSGDVIFGTTSGTLSVGTTTIVNMNYGEVPKTYLTGGTFINGTLQLPTTLRVIATGGGIQFQQQSAPSTNSLLSFGNDTNGVYFGNFLSLGVRFLVGSTPVMTLASTTANVLINTTTDAGFKLDVNGTARVVNDASFNANVTFGGGVNIVDSGQIYRSSGAIAFQSFQGVGNNNSVLVNINPNTTSITNVAILAANSTTKGFLPPRMTQAQRNAIASPVIGLEIYQTDATEGKYIYKSSGWTYIG